MSNIRHSESIWFPLMFAILFVSDRSLAVSPKSQDPETIMRAVDKRETEKNNKADLQMTIIDKKGRERHRTLLSRSFKFAEGTKMLMIFSQPADIRNTGLLSIDYDSSEKDDDQWLYLPSLGKSTRIASNNKSGSFMGSDFSYADMTRNNVSEYSYKMVEQNIKVDGEDCWVIESRPKSDKLEKETGYIKTHSWISKEKLMPIQVKAWIKKGRKLKYIKFNDIKKLDNLWVAHKLTAKTVRGKSVLSSTILLFNNLVINAQGVTEEDFTQRRLEKGL